MRRFIGIVIFLLACLPGFAQSVTVSWNASTTTGVTYSLYRLFGTCPTGTSGFTLIASGLTALTYSDTAVVAGDTYCYYATSVDGTGDASVPSNTAAATVPTSGGGGITVTSISGTMTIKATWTDSPKAATTFTLSDSQGTILKTGTKAATTGTLTMTYTGTLDQFPLTFKVCDTTGACVTDVVPVTSN